MKTRLITITLITCFVLYCGAQVYSALAILLEGIQWQ